MDNCGKVGYAGESLLAVDSFGCGVSLWQGGMRIVPSGGFSGFRVQSPVWPRQDCETRSKPLYLYPRPAGVRCGCGTGILIRQT